ncbi:MAG: DUF3786 domain-containing protein [Desulfobacteraceae bacterium]|jgi:hypothetical protein
MDDYKQASQLGRDALAGKNGDLVAGFSGADIQRDRQGNTTLSLDFLNQEVIVSWPDLEFLKKGSNEELPIQQEILLLHYLHGAWVSSGAGIEEEWIAFQEVPDGRFYLDAFQRRAKNPMVQAFGNDPELLVKLGTEFLGATPFDQGDFSILIKALPLIPVALILWRGDEEFPPEGNILFDRSVSKILSAEDIAWLSGMVVYPLIGMAKAKG